jgi:hypothetical protein
MAADERTTKTAMLAATVKAPRRTRRINDEKLSEMRKPALPSDKRLMPRIRYSVKFSTIGRFLSVR